MTAQESTPSAILGTIQARIVSAHTHMALVRPWDLDGAMASWQEAYRLGIALKECFLCQQPGTEKMDYLQAISLVNQAAYHLALCHYLKNDSEQALSLLAGLAGDGAQILRGILLFEGGQTGEDFESAFSALSRISENEAYAGTVKSEYEDFAYAAASVDLALCYRTGLGRMGAPPDLAAAVKTLSDGKRHVKNREGIALLEKELAHYREKLLGGYRYLP